MSAFRSIGVTVRDVSPAVVEWRNATVYVSTSLVFSLSRPTDTMICAVYTGMLIDSGFPGPWSCEVHSGARRQTSNVTVTAWQDAVLVVPFFGSVSDSTDFMSVALNNPFNPFAFVKRINDMTIVDIICDGIIWRVIMCLMWVAVWGMNLYWSQPYKEYSAVYAHSTVKKNESDDLVHRISARPINFIVVAVLATLEVFTGGWATSLCAWGVFWIVYKCVSIFPHSQATGIKQFSKGTCVCFDLALRVTFGNLLVLTFPLCAILWGCAMQSGIGLIDLETKIKEFNAPLLFHAYMSVISPKNKAIQQPPRYYGEEYTP